MYEQYKSQDVLNQAYPYYNLILVGFIYLYRKYV